MQTLFEKMRAHRVRWVDQPIQPQGDDWRLKAMVVDGQMYVEAPERQAAFSLCTGCAFISGCCDAGWSTGKAAFGGSCSERNVIYIRAE